MISEVKKWGNSLAIRLSKNELSEYNVKEGDRIKITIEKIVPIEEIDLSDLPLFTDTDKKVSEQHDIYLYSKQAK
jgi:hypothetical protein